MRRLRGMEGEEAPHSACFALCLSAATVPGKKVNVPTWILAFGGCGIVTGLATYGWHIMGLYGEAHFQLRTA